MPKFLNVVASRKTSAISGRLRITKPGQKAAVTVNAPAVGADASALLSGKAVFFSHGGSRVAGVVKSGAGGDLRVKIAVPDENGILLVSDSEVVVRASDVDVVDAVTKTARLRSFETGIGIEADKKFTVIYENDDDGKATRVIEDYQNVAFEGYGSTFVETTPKDRIGDYIKPGAFNKTIADFMRNPVLLKNHENRCDMLAGSFEKIGIDKRGLSVRAFISNSPSEIDTRFKVAEGHLKALSIGGLFRYEDDGFGIYQVDLYEISLVPVPMNPDALVQVRGLDLDACAKAFRRYGSKALRGTND